MPQTCVCELLTCQLLLGPLLKVHQPGAKRGARARPQHMQVWRTRQRQLAHCVHVELHNPVGRGKRVSAVSCFAKPQVSYEPHARTMWVGRTERSSSKPECSPSLGRYWADRLWKRCS